jgi:hypothetical protein
VRAASAEPTTPLASEALVRLGALTSGAVGGVDFGPDSFARAPGGIDACRRRGGEGDAFADDTTCLLTAPEAHLIVQSPTGGPAVLLVRARARAEGPLALEIALAGQSIARIGISGLFAEQRVALAPGLLHRGANQLTLRVSVAPGRRAPLAELDHALLLPLDE